jgi:hypothetical protein
MDPQLERRGITVLGVRFRGEETGLDDGELRYELAVALERTGKTWPKGDYNVQVYDEAGVLLARSSLDLHKALEASRRHLEGSFYSEPITRAELIFEAPGDDVDTPEWEKLDVTLDAKAETALSIESRSWRAECRPDFEYNNLLVIAYSGEVRASFGLPFPTGLCAQLSVLDDEDVILTSAQLDLRNGPDGSRTLSGDLKVYDHQTPSTLRVEYFTV